MSNKLYKTLFLLIIISIGSKVLGFLREFILAYKYGATYITDAYIASLTLTVTFIGGIIGAFFTAYIPVYSDVMAENKDKGGLYNNKLLTITLLISFAFIIIYYILNDYLVKLIAPGFDTQAFLLTKSLSNILIFTIILNAIRSVVGGYLQYNDKVELVYSNIFITLNIFTIISIMLSSEEHPEVLGYGYLIGAIIAIFLLLFHAFKIGFRYKPNFNLKDKHIFQTLIILGPVFINVALMDINTLVDRVVASFLGEGVVSALAYGYKVNEIMIVLFATTMGQAIFPHISKLVSASKIQESMDLTRKSLILATIIILPISILMIIFSDEVIKLLFMRGAFNRSDVIITAQVLSAYSFGMIFFAYRQILYRVMLSFKMSKYIMYNSMMVVGVNIVLTLTLYKKFQHTGIALASSIATMLLFIFMVYELEKKVSTLSLQKAVKSLLKIIVSIALMIFVAIYSFKLLSSTIFINSSSAAFLIAAFFSVIVYGVMLYILKTEEIKFIATSILSKFKKKNS